MGRTFVIESPANWPLTVDAIEKIDQQFREAIRAGNDTIVWLPPGYTLTIIETGDKADEPSVIPAG